MLTIDQVKARTKTVTRRMGWADLKPGTLLQAIEKGQGLRRGEKVKRLGVIRVVDVRREPLSWMLSDPVYGADEIRKEGFADDPVKWIPDNFVAFFCKTHDCLTISDVTRIEFEYVDL